MDTLWQIPSLGGGPGHAWLGVSFLQDWDMTNMTNIINITPDREICIKFASHSTAAWQTNHLELRADCRTGQITPVSMLHQLEIVWVYLTLGCSCLTYWAQSHLICWLAPENIVKIFLTITATAPRAQTIFSELRFAPLLCLRVLMFQFWWDNHVGWWQQSRAGAASWSLSSLPG